jgi:TonB family protein
MRATEYLRAIILSSTVLCLGCASGGGGHGSTALCQDRSRFGFPERLSQEQLEDGRDLVQRIGAAGAELFPISGTQPDILNRSEIAQALEREYPPTLRNQGISGTAHVTMLVTESGRVEHVEVSESAGHAALDQAAVRVAQGIEFSGLHSEGAPICYVTAMPVSFITR